MRHLLVYFSRYTQREVSPSEFYTERSIPLWVLYSVPLWVLHSKVSSSEFYMVKYPLVSFTVKYSLANSMQRCITRWVPPLVSYLHSLLLSSLGCEVSPLVSSEPDPPIPSVWRVVFLDRVTGEMVVTGVGGAPMKVKKKKQVSSLKTTFFSFFFYQTLPFFASSHLHTTAYRSPWFC